MAYIRHCAVRDTVVFLDGSYVQGARRYFRAEGEQAKSNWRI